MKTWLAVAVIALLVAVALPALGEQAKANNDVPKYDVSKEVTIKGVVQEVVDRSCPVSGGVGAHLMLKLGDGNSIEVHLAPTKFVKNYELVFAKGDQVEVLGSKVNFEGKDTIFARQITRGNDSFVFRDDKGKPVW
jgi:DNA/RNA endonuclease YhcR with UshA esterase domain